MRMTAGSTGRGPGTDRFMKERIAWDQAWCGTVRAVPEERDGNMTVLYWDTASSDSNTGPQLRIPTDLASRIWDTSGAPSDREFELRIATSRDDDRIPNDEDIVVMNGMYLKGDETVCYVSCDGWMVRLCHTTIHLEDRGASYTIVVKSVRDHKRRAPVRSGHDMDAPPLRRSSRSLPCAKDVSSS